MKQFYHLLANSLLVATKNNFVWFALTYWAYLSTQSVIATSLVGGTFLVAAAVSSFWFGSLVDHYQKKKVLVGSNIATLVLFSAALLLYGSNPLTAFSTVMSPLLWLFILLLLGGVIAGSTYAIAVPTLVTVMVPEDRHAKANGMFGTVMGISFAITSVASGLALGFLGMGWVLIIAIGLTVVAIMHVVMLTMPIHAHTGTTPSRHQIDIAGTIAAIRAIPGLFSLIFFTTFNNFLGGVFMALMDAYGLSLVSVQTWGILWGFLSFGFIFGGLYIAKKGLGDNPVKTLFRINIILWIICIFFTVQPSILLLAVGCLIWMSLVPFVEAIEQTIIQKVVPPKRQGRVFGFAHSIEQAASPLTAFFIGPITQLFFIPFMTTGAGVNWIGTWFGVGIGRGIALVFIISGLIGLMVTLYAMRSPAYKELARQYAD